MQYCAIRPLYHWGMRIPAVVVSTLAGGTGQKGHRDGAAKQALFYDRYACKVN